MFFFEECNFGGGKMANIKKADNDKKRKIMSIKLTAEQRKKIEEESKKNNMSMSAYVVKKATQEGVLSVRKESNRIIRLTETEDAITQLRKTIKADNPSQNILNALDNVEKEFIKLWHC